MYLITNFLLFQAAWFSSVLGAANQMPTLVSMSQKSNRMIIIPAVLICMSAVAWGDKPDSSYSLDFDVYLDDSKIGYHRFDITNNDNGMRQVRSEAKFDVKFLFFNAFRYRHENAELWNDGCLMKIDSETDSNGKEIVVNGVQNDSGFNVRAGDSSDELPSCVMTFAYWNPDFLKEQRLLNPQTGEYLEVEINQRSEETLNIGGRELPAVPYSIRARGMELTVWYSPDNRWLALESLAKGGRTIRYELT